MTTPPEWPAAPRSTGRAPAAPGAFQLLQIGAVCGVAIGLGVLAGYLLDQALGTSPLLVFVGLAVGILGAAVGSYQVIRPYLSDPPTRVADPKD